MRPLLDFDDAGATDDHPAKGVTVGDIRAWFDEIERLRALVRDAYNEAFGEGMREHTSSRGGKPWAESRARAALAVNIFWSSEDAGYIAVDTTRPGCSALGKTKAECLCELADARAAWDEALRRAHTMRADITSPEPQSPANAPAPQRSGD